MNSCLKQEFHLIIKSLSFCPSVVENLETGAEGPSFQIFHRHWGRRHQRGRSPLQGAEGPPGGEAPLEKGARSAPNF